MDPVIRAALEAVADAIEAGALTDAHCEGAVLHGCAVGLESMVVPDQMIEITAAGVVMPVY